LRRKGIGPPGWTPHWLRHSHATALQIGGVAFDASFDASRDRRMTRTCGFRPVASVG
jgi:hypothetical protein